MMDQEFEQLYFLKDVHFIVPGVRIQRVSIQKCRYYGIWKNVVSIFSLLLSAVVSEQE